MLAPSSDSSRSCGAPPDDAAAAAVAVPTAEETAAVLLAHAVRTGLQVRQRSPLSAPTAVVLQLPGAPNIRRLLASAAAAGAHAAVIIGPGELERGEVSVKDLVARTQATLPLDLRGSVVPRGLGVAPTRAPPDPQWLRHACAPLIEALGQQQLRQKLVPAA